MASDIIMPKIGFSMVEGELTEWLAADGSSVTRGQPLFNIESDKSVTEVEAQTSGILRISAQAGETYQVGTVIGTIE